MYYISKIWSYVFWFGPAIATSNFDNYLDFLCSGAPTALNSLELNIRFIDPMICGTISGGLINFSSDFNPFIGRVLAGVRERTQLSRLDFFQSLFKTNFWLVTKFVIRHLLSQVRNRFIIKWNDDILSISRKWIDFCI